MLDLILRLKARGIGIVVISHNMRHVFSVFDRIMVLGTVALQAYVAKARRHPTKSSG